MFNKCHWLFWAIAIVLMGNFALMMLYGDTLRSTHLFIVRSTVFYPVALLNLALGLALIIFLIMEMFHKK
jgi:hypothetical protein